MGESSTPESAVGITSYHAHVYYDPPTTRHVAEQVRAGIAERFPSARLGRWHDALVGPHTRAMFQVAFGSDLFPALVPWLMLNRGGLSVLLHPETGDARADHLAHTAWLGEQLALDASVLPTKAA